MQLSQRVWCTDACLAHVEWAPVARLQEACVGMGSKHSAACTDAALALKWLHGASAGFSS